MEDPANARVVDSGFHRKMLIVFALFGTVPTLMSLAIFAFALENRRRVEVAVLSPHPRLVTAFRYARILANLALIYGTYVSLRTEDVAPLADGFPIIGAAAGAHGVIGILAGMRLSVVLGYFVIAAGFVVFGLFADAVT